MTAPTRFADATATTDPSGGSKATGAGLNDWAALLDLDDTLVLSRPLKPLRDAREWHRVAAGFAITSLPAGTAAFIDDLRRRDFVVGVVTSAPRGYAEALLAHHGLPLKVATAYHDTKRHKPDPDPIAHGCSVLGCDVRRAFYVGDEPTDAAAATAAGALPVGVGWYPDSPASLAPRVTVLRDWRAVTDHLVTVRASLKAVLPSPPPPAPPRATHLPPRRRTAGEAILDALRAEAIGEWKDLDYAILPYVPTRGATTGWSASTQVILEFKDADAAAIKALSALAIEHVRAQERRLRDLDVRSVIALPRSTPAHRPTANIKVTEALAAEFDWLALLPPLERTIPVPASHLARRGQRTTWQNHAASLAYPARAPRRLSGSVMMVDDVTTHGLTAFACRRVLMDATGCAMPVGLFMSRTKHRR